MLHDADPDGYNIARTLREETRRMPGYSVDVIDLGLKLEEALGMDLGMEEFSRKRAVPEGLMLTETERAYFEGRRAGERAWICQRVELNAFSAPALVAYIEEQLLSSGVRGKVIPPDEVLPRLEKATWSWRAALEAKLRTFVREVSAEVELALRSRMVDAVVRQR